ncbi:MAG: hypothetical protein ABSF21_01130 [Dehalococcoidia bacterium]
MSLVLLHWWKPYSDLLPKLLLDNPVRGLIAENIVRAVNGPNLEQIARNARALVEREFTHEAAVEGYRRILENLRQRD